MSLPELRLHRVRLNGVWTPEQAIRPGQRIGLRLDDHLHSAFWERLYGAPPHAAPLMTLMLDGKEHAPGDPGFHRSVVAVIQGNGLICNLSLRENLVLPFLFFREWGVERACGEVDTTAREYGLNALDERSGERDPVEHFKVGLARAWLQRARFLIVQDLHLGMMGGRLDECRRHLKDLVRRLDAGLVIVASRHFEDWGLKLHSTLTVETGVA